MNSGVPQPGERNCRGQLCADISLHWYYWCLVDVYQWRPGHTALGPLVLIVWLPNPNCLWYACEEFLSVSTEWRAVDKASSVHLLNRKLNCSCWTLMLKSRTKVLHTLAPNAYFSLALWPSSRSTILIHKHHYVTLCHSLVTHVIVIRRSSFITRMGKNVLNALIE